MSLPGNSLTFCIPKFYLACHECNFAVVFFIIETQCLTLLCDLYRIIVFCNHLINFDFSNFLNGMTIDMPQF